MSATATLPKPHAIYASAGPLATFKGHEVEAQPDGSAIVRGVEVLKVGSFRDSFGEQQTYEVEHLQQMVDNFDLLRARNLFTDVPVRRDHTRSVDTVMGYFESLAVVGDRLVADLRVTEPEQIEKLARGTYRHVSIEIGMYEDNSGALYWPTVFGVAYVDIPAVEGLHSKSLCVFSRTDSTEEKPVSNENQPANTNQNDDRGAQRPIPHTFMLAGEATTDFSKVQAHIANLESRNEALEKFAKDTADESRKNYVKGLVAANKIVAAQEEGLTAFALGLTDDQFASWKGTYETAPALSVLGEHGNGVTNPEGQPSKADQEILDLEDMLKMHRNAGLSEDKIKQTKSYARLQELKNASK